MLGGQNEAPLLDGADAGGGSAMETVVPEAYLDEHQRAVGGAHNGVDFAATPPGGAVVALHETQAPPLQPGDGLGFGCVSLGTRVRACRAPASCCSAEKESHCRPSLLP